MSPLGLAVAAAVIYPAVAWLVLAVVGAKPTTHLGRVAAVVAFAAVGVAAVAIGACIGGRP